MAAPAPARRPASGTRGDRRSDLERVVLALASVATAVPLLLGWGRHAGLLDTVAAFLARHGLAGSGLAIPLDWAREAGQLLLVVRVGLQFAAALALWRFARAIGLARVAFVDALLLLLAPGYATGAQGALVGATLVLWATERCLATKGAPGLAFAIATAAALAPASTLPPVAVLAVGWGGARLATGLVGRRVAGSVRLALGVGFGLLLAAPAIIAGLLAILGGVVLPGIDTAALGIASRLGASFGTMRTTHDALLALAPMLPVFGLALLAPSPVAAARPLRLALALAAAAALLWPAAVPLLRLPLVLLAGITLDDAARGLPAAPRRRFAAGAIAAAAAVCCALAGADHITVAAGSAAALLGLVLLHRRLGAATALCAGAVADLVALNVG